MASYLSLFNLNRPMSFALKTGLLQMQSIRYLETNIDEKTYVFYYIFLYVYRVAEK